MPSFFSIPWAEKFCDKIFNYNKKIIAGGKWVVSGNEKWLSRKLKGVSKFIPTNAEHIIENLIQENIKDKKNNNGIHQKIPAYLDYSMVHNFEKYQPSVEISRGCGLGCSFCLEKNSPYQLVKSPEDVVLNILKHQDAYQSTNITPYFQSSFFNPSMDWCSELLKYFQKYSLSTKWRTQTRIDALSRKKLENLAHAGLKVLDLGLESASHKQIVSMNKSKNPSGYLTKASQLLKMCYENDIWVKLNILFYPGETLETIKETTDWLKYHKLYIKGLSINPLFIYRYNGVEKFINKIKHLGASIVKEKSLEKNGYVFLNLSRSVSFVKANEISLRIQQEIVSQIDYFELKSFSYFNRLYSYDNFQNDIKIYKGVLLPFYRKR